jgi:hypothetical protein
MTYDPIANLNALMANLNTTTATSNPATTPEPASKDWKADFYDVITSDEWKVVGERIGTKFHDHSPMPPKHAITSVQVGLIRKARKPAKKNPKAPPPSAISACVEIWTVPEAQIVRHKNHTQWRKFSQLRDSVGFEFTVKNALGQKHITEEFASWAMKFAYRQRRDEDLFGLIHDVNNGWHYYDLHLVHICMANCDQPVADLYRNGERVASVEMSTEFAHGEPMPNGDTQTHVGRV